MPRIAADPKNPISVRVTPKFVPPLCKLADARGDAVSAHIRRLIEAYTRHMYYCPVCQTDHPIHGDAHDR